MTLLLIAIAGALGATARFVVDRAIAQRVESALPWGTWAVNISGSLMLGLIAGATLPTEVAIVVGTGFLGAYTTFSTWMYESLVLIERGAWRVAAMNLIGPAISGPPAAVVGLMLAGYF